MKYVKYLFLAFVATFALVACHPDEPNNNGGNGNGEGEGETTVKDNYMSYQTTDGTFDSLQINYVSIQGMGIIDEDDILFNLAMSTVNIEDELQRVIDNRDNAGSVMTKAPAFTVFFNLHSPNADFYDRKYFTDSELTDKPMRVLYFPLTVDTQVLKWYRDGAGLKFCYNGTLDIQKIDDNTFEVEFTGDAGNLYVHYRGPIDTETNIGALQTEINDINY